MKSQYPTFAEGIYLLKKPFYYLQLRSWFLRRSAVQIHLPQQFPPSLEVGNALIGEELLDGFFEFDGERHEFETSSWRFKMASDNWHKNLHAFTWLHHLKATGKDEARSAAAAIVLDWCQKHKKWRRKSWNTLTTAKRVCSWLSLFDYISAKMTPEQKRLFVTQLWTQVLHLKHAYPLDAVGADRLTVAKSLLLSDLAFFGEANVKFAGWKLLEKELRRQVLPDGGVIERSAGKNLQALIDLIEVRAAFRAFGQVVPSTLDLAIRLVGTVVEALKMPDGELAHHHVGISSQLLSRATALSGDVEARYSFPESGFERLEAKRSVLIINTGQIDTPAFNRQLHASPLAFEFSLGKQRLIVNCGSHPNQAKFARIERTTAAHSTLVVDDLNALPIVAVKGVKALCLKGQKTSEVRVVREASDKSETVQVGHGHYERVGGGYHTRQLQLESDGEMLLGMDQVSNCEKAELCIRFHLHPDILTRIMDEMVFLRMPTGRPWRFDAKSSLGNTSVSIEDSVYLENGLSKATRQIVVKQTVSAGSARVDWTLAREGRASRQSL